MPTEHISDADLDWVAFQYASGELQGADLDAFENLLAINERACCAVASAVLLVESVRSIEAATPRALAVASQKSVSDCVRRTSSSVAFNRRVLTACTVACAALFVGWFGWMRSPAVDRTSSVTEVASLWVAGADENETVASALPEESEIDLTEEDAVPGWLMAAVSEQQQSLVEEEIMND